jgi:hypothetical protein
MAAHAGSDDESPETMRPDRDNDVNHSPVWRATEELIHHLVLARIPSIQYWHESRGTRLDDGPRI